MSEGVILLFGLIITGALMLIFFGATHAAEKPISKRKREPADDERDWLDQPGDDFGSGWTNFDYIAAAEMDEVWDGDE